MNKNSNLGIRKLEGGNIEYEKNTRLFLENGEQTHYYLCEKTALKKGDKIRNTKDSHVIEFTKIETGACFTTIKLYGTEFEIVKAGVGIPVYVKIKKDQNN